MKNTALLIADVYHINDFITMRIPTVREILEFGEDNYFNAIYNLCATPYDCMAQLDEKGIDYENITEFQLFWYTLMSMTDEQANMIFVGLRPKEFQVVHDDVCGGEKLISANGTIIDINVQNDIQAFIRKVHRLTKNTKKAGNSAAKRFLLERAKKKLRKMQAEDREPYLESLVINIVNAPEFSYTFETCLGMNIYAFNASVQQINKRVEYDHIMSGVYAGTVDFNKLNLEKIHWLSTK